MSLVICALCACASQPYMLPETDENNTAPGEAFTADGMHFRKEMPDHRDWKPLEFYYKQCDNSTDRPYYSKTAYECTGPY